MASKVKAQISDKVPFVAKYIGEKKLDTVLRVDAALNYLMSNIKETVDTKAFEEACGVGIVITPEQIEEAVEKLILTHKEEILEKRSD